jgi:hypothetical protein
LALLPTRYLGYIVGTFPRCRGESRLFTINHSHVAPTAPHQRHEMPAPWLARVRPEVGAVWVTGRAFTRPDLPLRLDEPSPLDTRAPGGRRGERSIRDECFGLATKRHNCGNVQQGDTKSVRERRHH